MKRQFVFLYFIFLFTVGVSAQYRYNWDKYSVSFQSPVKLDLYETESEDVFGSDNDEYAVDISGFDINYYNQYINKTSWKKAAFDIANAYGFINTKDGGTLPNISQGYYVICESKSSILNAPNAIVILVMAVDEKKKHYIEGTVYCYNQNEQIGIKIAKTFSFN